MPSRPSRAWTVAPLSGLPLSPCRTRGGSRMPSRHTPATARRAGSLHEIPGMHTALDLMHLPADDLAAVQINDQIQEVELPADRSGQPGDVPASHRVGLVSNVCRWGPRCPGRFGPPPMMRQVMGSQYAIGRRFRRQVDSLSGPSPDDLARRQSGPATARRAGCIGLQGGLENGLALVLGQRMGRRRSHRRGTPVSAHSAASGPALIGAGGNAQHRTGRFQSRPSATGLINQRYSAGRPGC